MSRATTTGWRALGTSVHVAVTDAALVWTAADAVRAVLAEVDVAYSRFRSDSEIVRVNAAAGRPTVVSPLLARAIETSLYAARATDGAVDPTIGRAIRAAGYDRDFAAITDDAPVMRLERVPGWRMVDLDRATRTLRLPSGVELDLGSTGKALAADIAARAALGATRRGGVLVSLGGDIAIAGGVPEDGWPILVAESSEVAPDEGGETIALFEGAVATSSTTLRRWLRGGVAMHHLIDPATGAPVRSPWRSASVIAATCVDANAAATGAIVRGLAAPDWLVELGLPSRLVSIEGEVHRIAGWPAPATAGVAA